MLMMKYIVVIGSVVSVYVRCTVHHTHRYGPNKLCSHTTEL